MRHGFGGLALTLRAMCVVPVLIASGCSGSTGDGTEVAARAVPATQSAAAQELRLPRMRLAPFGSSAAAVTLRVHVVVEGAARPDSAAPVSSIDPACVAGSRDTVIAQNGTALIGALLWVEGAATVVNPTATSEHRPTVVLEQCRLSPRLQVAAPGSTIQLVSRDQRAESLVIVPSSLSTPIDTVTFIAEGQLVPVRHRTDSVGVLGIYATRLPSAKAFVAITPPGLSAISDFNGLAVFSFAAGGQPAVIHAWHPSLGVVRAKVDIPVGKPDADVTITFRR